MARKYNIIYADPPWSYNRKIGRGIAETQYQTMSIDEIGSIPVNKITADDAMLFLWVTFPQLKEGLSVIESWGFKYKTCAFNWIKQNLKSDTFFCRVWILDKKLLGNLFAGNKKTPSQSIDQCQTVMYSTSYAA